MNPDPEPITSVGIDVGTTTTQVVVSRLRVSSPTHDGAAAPEIRDREVVYRGRVHETPLVDAATVDIDGVAGIVVDAFASAGIDPGDVDTGAVIVTGEAAKRRNAEPLVRRIADDAGEFVAAAAGGALEAVLAGRGSGAADHAARTGRVVANVDVGGGTTNVAVFAGDTLVDTRVIDVGARIVRVEGRARANVGGDSGEADVDDGAGDGDDGANAADDGERTRSDTSRISHLSPAAERLIAVDGLDVAVGGPATPSGLQSLADAAAAAIADALVGPPFDDVVESLAIGPLPERPVRLDDVVLTGGVGSLANTIDDRSVDTFRFDDLGPLLAASLRRTLRGHADLPDRPLTLSEDLRATVVGVGTESTTFSGRTVWLPTDRLPLRDVPVVVVDPPGATRSSESPEPPEAPRNRFERAIGSARALYDVDDVSGLALYLPEVGSLAYDDLGETADGIAAALRSLDRSTARSVPVVVVTRENCANVLGQLLAARLDEPVPVIDELRLRAGVRLDVGKPFAGREAVPVVVKTLAFGG